MTRGRPKGSTKRFLEDNDRYAVALADALVDFGFSQRGAFDMAAVLVFGSPIAPDDSLQIPEGRPGFDFFSFKMRRRSVGVASRASTLLKKAKRANSDEDMHWRSTMKTAINVAMHMKNMGQNVRAELVFSLCKSVGEEHFAQVCLAPLFR